MKISSTFIHLSLYFSNNTTVNTPFPSYTTHLNFLMIFKFLVFLSLYCTFLLSVTRLGGLFLQKIHQKLLLMLKRDWMNPSWLRQIFNDLKYVVFYDRGFKFDWIVDNIHDNIGRLDEYVIHFLTWFELYIDYIFF